MHAMTGRDITGKLQTADEAKTLANSFVREQFKIAWKYQDLGKDDLAMQHFGFALHTLQDSTSPEHNGFQKWVVKENKVTRFFYELNHGYGEAFNPNPYNSNFARVTRDAASWFLSRELPKGNLFVYGSDHKDDKFQNPYGSLNLSINNLK